MPPSISRRWVLPSRALQLLLSIAIAVPLAILTQLLFGEVSLRGVGQSLVIVLVYSLCLGSLFAVSFQQLEQRVSAVRFPFDWVLFIALFALLTGLGAAIASFILYLAGFVPDRTGWDELLFINRLVFGLSLLFGIFSFLYGRTKSRLAERNVELQRDLERESRQSRATERELEQARRIQEGLLPNKLPRIAGFSLFGAWRPARSVSGDYYDVLPLADDALGLCIADVVGKGIGAALLMSNLQAAVKTFASPAMSPAELCDGVNRVINSHVAAGKFITFFYGLLNPQTGLLRYCCAGHNPPIVARADGSVLRLQTGGPVLGVFPDRRYQEGVLATAPGDRLLLFTDGVTEAVNSADEEFGDQRLTSLVVENRDLRAKQLTQKVLGTVTRFTGGSLTDDATLMALSVE